MFWFITYLLLEYILNFDNTLLKFLNIYLFILTQWYVILILEREEDRERVRETSMW